jgi:hypothetical protein
MLAWGEWAAFMAAALVAGGALYMRLRWRRSPQAYRAMIALAVCYFEAGSLVSAWVMHLAGPKPSVSGPEVASLGAGVTSRWEEPSARKTHARIRERKSRMAGVNARAKLHHWAGVKVHQ